MSTFFFSDQQIFYVIRAEILRAFTAFATDTLHEYYSVLKVNPAIAKVPIIVSTYPNHMWFIAKYCIAFNGQFFKQLLSMCTNSFSGNIRFHRKAICLLWQLSHLIWSDLTTGFIVYLHYLCAIMLYYYSGVAFKNVNKFRKSLFIIVFQIEPPIYGTMDPSFVNFMAPGIILRFVHPGI